MRYAAILLVASLVNAAHAAAPAFRCSVSVAQPAFLDKPELQLIVAPMQRPVVFDVDPSKAQQTFGFMIVEAESPPAWPQYAPRLTSVEALTTFVADLQTKNEGMTYQATFGDPRNPLRVGVSVPFSAVVAVSIPGTANQGLAILSCLR